MRIAADADRAPLATAGQLTSYTTTSYSDVQTLTVACMASVHKDDGNSLTVQPGSV